MAEPKTMIEMLFKDANEWAPKYNYNTYLEIEKYDKQDEYPFAYSDGYMRLSIYAKILCDYICDMHPNIFRYITRYTPEEQEKLKELFIEIAQKLRITFKTESA